MFGGGFEGWIHRFVDAGAAYPFFAPVLRGFVLPHARAVALLVAWGELAIGISLDHLVPALCFAAFAAGRPSAALAVLLKN